MEIGNGQTQSCGWLKASGRGVHADCWGLERVVWWEHEGAPILTVMVGSVGWSGQYVVPSVMVQVGLVRQSRHLMRVMG